jgi:hypothetical protein
MTTDQYGNKYCRNSKGQFHRIDGPAIEGLDGFKAWYVNGKRHRVNGPAIEYPNDSKSWYINGKWLGSNDTGFWNLWDTLTPEQKGDPALLSYLPEKF